MTQRNQAAPPFPGGGLPLLGLAAHPVGRMGGRPLGQVGDRTPRAFLPADGRRVEATQARTRRVRAGNHRHSGDPPPGVIQTVARPTMRRFFRRVHFLLHRRLRERELGRGDGGPPRNDGRSPRAVRERCQAVRRCARGVVDECCDAKESTCRGSAVGVSTDPQFAAKAGSGGSLSESTAPCDSTTFLHNRSMP